MFLVVGLAIAGVVGIAAAFYFSIRSGGDKRLRTAGAGRAGADRRPGSRSSGTARPDRADNASRTANGRRPANTGRAANGPSRNYRAEATTGPNPVLDFGDPVLAGGRRGGPGVSAGDSQATDPKLAAAEGGAGRPRRRVGFRKGADVDEELWPTESFGGVSDEQFWDDLASDKPLTTTRVPPSRILGPGTGRSMRCRRPRPRRLWLNRLWLNRLWLNRLWPLSPFRPWRRRSRAQPSPSG